MSRKNQLPPGVCSDYELADSGVIRVARCFSSPVEAYEKRGPYPDYLSLVDHDHALTRKEYKRGKAEAEKELFELARQLEEKKLSLVVVFQGRDSAGKTGASKRIIKALDYDWRTFQVVPVGPPTEEERKQSYLLRFFERDRMPSFGEVRVFDRSWAEELLVVPVMSLASKVHVQNAYSEIRTMEWLLRRSRTVVVKIWLDITKEEQASRFERREKKKPHKYQDSDIVARSHWDDYTKWSNRMFYWTGSEHAPWFIVPADDKHFSRVTCLRIINQELRRELESPFREI